MKHFNRKLQKLISIFVILLMILLFFNIRTNGNYPHNNIANNKMVPNDSYFNLNNSNVYIKYYVFSIKNNTLHEQNLKLFNIYKNKHGINKIYGNNNITIDEKYIIKNNSINSIAYLTGNINMHYIVYFTAITFNHNKGRYNSYEELNNSIVDFGKLSVISNNKNSFLISNNKSKEVIIPYNVYLSKHSIYKIDPLIKPMRIPINFDDTWSVSGYTKAPGNALYKKNTNLCAYVTSFSESPSNIGGSSACFIVSNKTRSENIHSFTIDGTGKFSYTWNDNLKGKLTFKVKYLSQATSAPSSSYSYFGNSKIDSGKYLSYMGYDGNNVIYLSNIPISTNAYYGSINLGHSNASVNKCGNALNFQKDSSLIDVSYCEGKITNQPAICIHLVSMGASNYVELSSPDGGCQFYTADYQHTGLTLNGAPSKASTQIQTVDNGGINVTGPNYKGTTKESAMISLGINLLSLLPYAGYVASSYSTYCNLYDTTGVNQNAISNHGAGTVYQNFEVDGGSMSMDSEGKNVFGNIENITIKIPPNELNQGFTINAFSTNYYECGGITAVVKSANASKTINAVPASALYGSVGTSYSTADRNTSLDSTLYIKDLNNGTIYKTPIVKGQYLFFAKPNTNYELMYLKNNQLIPFESKNSSGPYNLTNIESPNAGNSSHIDMFYR